MSGKRITVIFEEAEEMDGWWVVHSDDLPGVVTQGEGLSHAIEMFKDAYDLMHAPDDALLLGRGEMKQHLREYGSDRTLCGRRPPESESVFSPTPENIAHTSLLCLSCRHWLDYRKSSNRDSPARTREEADG